MRRFLLALAAVAATASAATAQDMIAVSWPGDVYTIDSGTGTGSLLTASGVSDLNAMALRSDGRVFAAGEGDGVTTPVYEIDTSSGFAVFTGSVPLESIRALAFDPIDVLYAINDRSTTGFDIDDLYVIDVPAGTASLIGSTNLYGIQAMTWGVDSFYAWECGSGSGTGLGLITIDPATAVCNDVNPSVGGACGEVQSLTFGPGGVLYGINDELFVVDTSTGVLTMVGGGGYSDVRGCEYIGPAGPVVYCTAKDTSIAGCVPTIGGPAATASLSAGAGSYDVTCGPLPGGPNTGILTYTTFGPLAVPIQSSFGWQCIPTGVGTFFVGPPQLSGGTPGTCSGAYTFDFGAYLAGPHGNPGLVSGATVDMQVFYRDPPNVGTANLSDALAFDLIP